MVVLPGNRFSAASTTQYICGYTDRLALNPRSQNEPLSIAHELDELIKNKIHAQDKEVREALTKIGYDLEQMPIGLIFDGQDPEQVYNFCLSCTCKGAEQLLSLIHI